MNRKVKRSITLFVALVMVLALLPVPRAEAAAMKQGSRGTEVRYLQMNLIGLGYLTGDADGSYGSKTYAAVQAFQADYGLAVDGSAGQATQTAVRNAMVRLQVELGKLGYAPGSADGHYGEKTKAAVKAFQRDRGLSDTGVADKTTRTAVDELSGGMRAYSAIPKGSSGTQVRYLQQALIGLGFMNDTADGKYGSMTEAAVRSFQSAYGLAVDGSAGRNTMTALKNAVVALQSDLARRGYPSGTINGVYGDGTRSAVKSYQRYVGINANGVAGPSTMRKLYGYAMGGSDATEPKTYKTWIDPLYQDGDYGKIKYYEKGYHYTTVNKSGCAGVALAMVMNALKNTDSYTAKDIMQWMADKNYYWGEGTMQEGLWDYPQRKGLNAGYCDTASDLIYNLKKGRLAIALIKDKTGDQFFVKSESRGHYVVVSGYRSKDGQDQVFINNPLSYKPSKWFDIDDLLANCCNDWEGYKNSFVVIYK